jgi:hypothetical protein
MHTQKALKDGGDLMGDEEQLQIQNALGELKHAREGEDDNLIREKIGQLDRVTHHLADLLMEQVVKTTLKGKKIG